MLSEPITSRPKRDDGELPVQRLTAEMSKRTREQPV